MKAGKSLFDQFFVDFAWPQLCDGEIEREREREREGKEGHELGTKISGRVREEKSDIQTVTNKLKDWKGKEKEKEKVK